MTKVLGILCILICISLSAKCQYYKDGTIVLTNGDTLKGRLSFDPLDKNSGLLYKPDKNSKAAKHNPKTIVSYQFEGSEDVWTATTIQRGETLDTLFLSPIIKGKAKLYKSQNASDKRFYSQKDNGPIEELMDELITKRVDGNLISYNSEKFKSQLKLLFADCPSMSKSLVKAALLESRLIKLFEEYNACVDLSGIEK